VYIHQYLYVKAACTFEILFIFIGFIEIRLIIKLHYHTYLPQFSYEYESIVL